MTAPFEETEQYRIGRRGEILAHILLSAFGCITLDAANIGNGRASMLHKRNTDLVSPDLMAFKTVPLWWELKGKSKHFEWNGGNRELNESGDRLMPPGTLAQGINAVARHRYLVVQHQTGIPVVLGIIAVKQAVFVANTLDALGEPYPSVNSQWPIVNWPVSSFIELFQFNPEPLHRYFFHHDGQARQPPTHMPNQTQREQLLELLQPVQRQFDFFRQHLFDETERQWSLAGGS